MSETHIKREEHLAPGQMIEGKYRIVRLLAEGGMGSVYHAVQEPLGRDVALKVLKPQDDTPEKRKQRYERFFREARHTSRLNHPNTVVIFDYGELSNREGFFFVMEFLEGRSLRELLVQKGSLSVDRALHIATQIASSLSDAHATNVIHRDLKPPNVMLVSRGDDDHFVKVVDFGLVKELDPNPDDDELTAENALIGSPMYMSPERFLYHGADSPAIDIYALGIMLYEMLVGRPPFLRASDSTLHHVMMQHIQDEPPAMGKFRPDLKLPDGLESLIMKCLAKEPGDRFPSMEALLRLLRACAATTGSHYRPITDNARHASIQAATDTSNVEIPSDQFFPSGTEDATRPAAPPPAAVLEAAGKLPNEAVAHPVPTATTDTVPAQKGANKTVWIGVVAVLFAVAIGAAALLFFGGPSQTVLHVTSSPAGAAVYQQGKNLGMTPLDVVIEEPTVLRFEKAGYFGTEYRVTESAGGERDVDVELAIAPSGEDVDEDSIAAEVGDGVEPDAGTEPGTRAEEVQQKDEKPAAKPRPRPRPSKKTRPKPKPDIDIKLDR